MKTPPHTTAAKVNPYILPPKPHVLQLLQLYFSRCHKLFPYIDERTFYEEYNTAELNGFQQIRRSWLALLNVLFAMALQLDGPVAEDRFKTADTFYQRARLLHHDNTINSLESSIPLSSFNDSPNAIANVSVLAKHPESKRMLGDTGSGH